MAGGQGRAVSPWCRSGGAFVNIVRCLPNPERGFAKAAKRFANAIGLQANPAPAFAKPGGAFEKVDVAQASSDSA